MNQPGSQLRVNRWTTLGLCLTILLYTASVGFTEETTPSTSPVQSHSTTEGGTIQERGVTKDALGALPGKLLERRHPSQPSDNPPPQLCREVTIMLTQCKCFNQAECQALTAILPTYCPAGSQHCEFVPLTRGTPPPLPPNLCGYQVPLRKLECACHNQAECQLLSPYCPGACPAGSQSCACTPLRRSH